MPKPKRAVIRDDGERIEVMADFDANGIFTAAFEADGCFYCVRFDSGYDNEDDADRSCRTVITSILG